MNKMEIELNDEQLEKVKTLEEYDIGIGDAIDMLFEVRDRVSSIIDAIDKDKLNGKAAKAEAEPQEEKPESTGKTYDVAIEDVKTHVSWANDFFKL